MSEWLQRSQTVMNASHLSFHFATESLCPTGAARSSPCVSAKWDCDPFVVFTRRMLEKNESFEACRTTVGGLGCRALRHIQNPDTGDTTRCQLSWIDPRKASPRDGDVEKGSKDFFNICFLLVPSPGQIVYFALCLLLDTSYTNKQIGMTMSWPHDIHDPQKINPLLWFPVPLRLHEQYICLCLDNMRCKKASIAVLAA